MLAVVLMAVGVLLVAGAVASWSIPAAVVVVGVALVVAGWDLAR